MMTQVEWLAMEKRMRDTVHEEMTHLLEDVWKKLDDLESKLAPKPKAKKATKKAASST